LRFEDLFQRVTFVPTLTFEIRRLYDVDRPGRRLLRYFTIIGMLFLVWKCTRQPREPIASGETLGVGDASVAQVFF
jgi:uncharacterized membrane protein YhaH (DUF805 family)